MSAHTSIGAGEKHSERHAYTHTHTGNVCTQITYQLTRAFMWTHVHMHLHTHVDTGADMIGGSKYLWLQQHWTHHAFTNDIEREFLCVCVYVCMCIYICIAHAYICVYIYTCIYIIYVCVHIYILAIRMPSACICAYVLYHTYTHKYKPQHSYIYI